MLTKYYSALYLFMELKATDAISFEACDRYQTLLYNDDILILLLKNIGYIILIEYSIIYYLNIYIHIMV